MPKLHNKRGSYLMQGNSTYQLSPQIIIIISNIGGHIGFFDIIANISGN